ncbi:MAG: hypothetical protein JNN07_10850 [Verrucomicrobiales bacterium]|nr:hypothetical protein [Verrucomicrobiales bacterium]
MNVRILLKGCAGLALASLGLLLPSSANAEIIADSKAEFSGVQGQNGWSIGYRNYTADGGEDNYDPAASFIEFAGGEGQGDWAAETQYWNVTFWDLNTAATGPWTELRAEDLHPNGVNSAPAAEHWCIRRWSAAELPSVTPVAIRWNARKANLGGGAGVTGGIWINGEAKDFAAIAFNDGVGVTHTYYANLNPTDVVDLVLTPVGPSGDRADGADGSANWMTIDTTIPSVPRQPNGRLFIPANSPDTDADGLPDFFENVFFPGDLTKLSGSGDYDGDGLKDAQELAIDTDPSKADSDGDGLIDGAETNTGNYVSATDAGTDPLKTDTDADGRTDGDEVLGTPTSHPLLVDTDGDGDSDGAEVNSGHDPNDPSNNLLSTLIANSSTEFSGVQGQEGWSYGYRNASGDGGSVVSYDPEANVTLFAGGEGQGGWDGSTQFWTGSQWDLQTAAAGPWDEIGRENSHPNGPSPVHWTVRRWEATELSAVTPLALRWHVRKGNGGCGNGVTGGIYVNGQLADKATIAFNDTVGVVRTVFINAKPTDKVDLVLTPRGTDNGDADGCDGSVLWLQVDLAIPPIPRQPDGSLFVPATASDSDADGLPDTWEFAYAPGNLTQFTGSGDNDGDGLNNVGELARGSHPLKADTDEDGLSDLVETATGTYVSASDTGSNPTKSDTDGDGRGDSAEVTGTPQTNPNKADTDGDGFSDTDELASGTNPNDAADNILTFVIANSIAEFSGVQGQNGWFNGYRNFTTDGGEIDYDPSAQFIAYAGGEGLGDWDGVNQFWNSGSWDLDLQARGPWTWQTPQGIHPNGVNSAPNEEHWAIRRWVASELTGETPVAIIWQVRKDNAAGGGVTGQLHINGKLVDSKTIPGADTAGETRRFYANLLPTDIVDLALTPQGPSDRADGSDGSVTWFWVDTRIPANPTQPDGTPFVPAGGLKITSVSYDAAAGKATLVWQSSAGKTYRVEASGNLQSWTEIATGVAGAAGETTYVESLLQPSPTARFYRVSAE